MLPAFIIHHENQDDRKDLVKALVEATNGTVIDPVWIPEDPVKGCRESHRKIALFAKEKFPDSPYLVFEDDCEILDPHFLDLIKEHSDVDILYFGVTNYCHHKLPFPVYHSWGTHAMMITPKARDIFLVKVDEYLSLSFPHKKHPVDQIFCVMEAEESLRVWKPDLKSMEKYVRQKPGLLSTIEKTVRRARPSLATGAPGPRPAPCQFVVETEKEKENQPTQ